MGQLFRFRSPPPTDYPNWVGIATLAWIDPEGPWRYVNHSCTPNVCAGSRQQIYVLSDIAAGTELTIDYSTTECDEHWQMDCHCGAQTCRGSLVAIQFAFDELPSASPAMQQAWKRARGLR